MKILILGASGMLGSTMFRWLSSDPSYEVWGSLRSDRSLRHLPEILHQRLVTNVEALDADALTSLFNEIRPDAVVNCVGVIKQVAVANDPLVVLPINAMLPHRLARICALAGARLIQISTDCVFSGRKGQYREEDVSDAEDLYGKSKYIGELHDLPHAVTLRTSIIGHELESATSLVDWFLAQNGRVLGYSKAVFSGLPTVELARVLKEFVLPRPDLHGLYHVAAEPIAKLDLLRLIAAQYGKSIDIEPDDAVVIDRSLNGERFRRATGYVAPPWHDLVRYMYEDRQRTRGQTG